MSNLKILVDLIQVDVPRAPKSVIRSAAIRKIREFCRKTRFWTAESTVYLSTGLNAATLDHPKDSEVIELVSVSKNGTPLDLVSEPAAMPSGNPNSVFMTLDEDYTLIFDGYASEDTEYKALFDCMPSLTPKDVDYKLVAQWGEEIASGSASYLMLQTDTAWANPNLAGVFSERFNNAVKDAINQKAVGGAKSRPTVKFRRWI